MWRPSIGGAKGRYELCLRFQCGVSSWALGWEETLLSFFFLWQIPIESDDNASGSEEAEEAVKEEGTAEKEVEEEEEMAQEDEDGSSTDHSDFNWSANSGEMLSLQDSVGAISEGDPGMDASLEIGENSMEDGLSQEGASLAEGVSAEVLEEGKGQSNKESTTSEQ